MDVDIGKLPEPHRLSPATEPASIPTLDGWIESLMNCKQLAENDVQRLCDRVCRGASRNIIASTWLGADAGLGSRGTTGRVKCPASGVYTTESHALTSVSAY